MSELSNKQLRDLRREARNIMRDREGQRSEAKDCTFSRVTEDMEDLHRVRLNSYKKLRGHRDRISALHWSSDSRNLVSASLCGDVIAWDTYTGRKAYSIMPTSGCATACAYAPSGSFIASCGSDYACSIHRLGTLRDLENIQHMAGHEGFINCCRFLDDTRILTCSGDELCALWDIETGQRTAAYRGHTADVTSVSVSGNINTFISGSLDNCAKLWDVRDGVCHQTFVGHESGINAVDHFPNEMAFGTGSEDSTCRLFDIRSDQEVMVYPHDDGQCGIASVGFSKSGRLLFAGDDDNNCTIWDSMKGDKVGLLAGHNDRVSCVGIANSGIVATGSWNRVIKVWM